MGNFGMRNLLLPTSVVLLVVGSVTAQSNASLLESFDPASQVVAGNWRQVDGELTVGGERGSRAVLAAKAPEDYSLTIEFTREEGDGSIGVVLPVGPTQCVLNMSVFNGEAHGIGVVGGKLARDNETSLKPGTLKSNHPYRLQIEVDVNGNLASISSTLDGRPFLKWEGSPSALTMLDFWKLPSKTAVGFCTYAKTTFHSAVLTPLDPGMRMTGPASKMSAAKPSAIETSPSEKQKSITFEGREWFAPQAESVAVESYRGKSALHIQGKEPNFVFLPEVEFGNGTIEVDVASDTFCGLGFHANSDGSIVEKLYFRPFNSGTAKHSNTVQHSMLGRPELGWKSLREQSPGKHESGADIETDKWFHVRVEVTKERVEAFVNDDDQPVLVGELLGNKKPGPIGIWGWDGYFANFRFTPKP